MYDLQEKVCSSPSRLREILEKEKNTQGEIIVSRSFEGELDLSFKFHFINAQRFCYVSDNLQIEIPLSNFGHVYFLSQMLCSRKTEFTLKAQKVYDSFDDPSRTCQKPQKPNPALNNDPKIGQLKNLFTVELQKGNIRSAMQLRRAIEDRENQSPTDRPSSTPHFGT